MVEAPESVRVGPDLPRGDAWVEIGCGKSTCKVAWLEAA